MTKLTSHHDVRNVRTRGGNIKFRALRLEAGNFAWASEVVARKTRIIDVVYNASNNELVSWGMLELRSIITILKLALALLACDSVVHCIV